MNFLMGAWTFKIRKTIGKSFPRMFSTGIILYKMVAQPKTLLDVGCGAGCSFDWLRRNDSLGKLSETYSVGLDVCKPSLREAKKVYHDVICCDCRYLPIKENSFDIVISTEVIEHLAKYNGYKLLKDFNTIAKRQILVTTPVMWINQPPTEYSLNPFMRHLSAWSTEEMKRLGFKVTGLMGIKSLFGESHQWGVDYRIKHYACRPFFALLKKVSQLVVYYYPNIAQQQLCIKNKSGSTRAEMEAILNK